MTALVGGNLRNIRVFTMKKNKLFTAVFLALMLVLGMMVVGCDDEIIDDTDTTNIQNTGGNNTGGNTGGNTGSNTGDNNEGNNQGNNNNGGTSVPSAPTGVSATAQSSSSIRVTWYSVSGATSYDVYYEIDSSSTKNFAGNATSTSYTHTGLTASTTYYYYIKAKNSAGESWYSSYSSATTSSSSSGGGTVTKPSAPTGVTASRTPRSNQYVTVSWNAVSEATSYRIYFSMSATGTYDLAATVTGTSSERFFYNDLTSYWKVSAMNDAGESALSSTYGTALGWQQQ